MSAPHATSAALWQADGSGVQDAADCGGDIQRSDAWSVRYTCPGLPGAEITVTYYAVEYDDAPGEFAVQRQVEWRTFRDPADPGGTETWSDIRYADVSPVVLTSAAAAGREAREHAVAALGAAAAHRWNGQPE